MANIKVDKKLEIRMTAKIVITGLGPVSSLGLGKNSSWDNLMRKNVGIVHEKNYVNTKSWQSYYQHKAEKISLSDLNIADDRIEEIRTWKESNDVVDLNYFIAAIKLALDDSGLKYSKKDKIGLVLAHENPGVDQFLLELFNDTFDYFKKRGFDKRKYFNYVYRWGVKKTYELQTFMFIHHIAKIFKIHNFSLFINCACASGMYALEVAADIIRSGKCDAVVVAAVDHSDVFKYLWFKNLGMYSSDGLIRPFSKSSNGLVLGDGGAALIVENFKFARNRNAHIYAEYAGGDFIMEGWKVLYPAIKEGYLKGVIRRAIERCGLRINDIDLIVPHGVGSRIIDSYEADAINKIFGKFKNKINITALKPYIGHNLGGSALLEIALLLLALDKGFIPPTLNVDSSNTFLDLKLLEGSRVFVGKYILKTCCAFAGFDAAVILKV